MAKDKKKLRYFTADKLQQFIINKNLLELILGSSLHVEVVKRSKAIFKFLARCNCLNNTQLDLLWSAGSGNQHEVNIRTVYEIVTDISKYLPVPNLEFLFSRIKEIPHDRCTDLTIGLILDFTVNAQHVISQMSTTSKFFCNFIFIYLLIY